MKKQIVTLVTLFFIAFLSQAQPVLTEYGAYDDFSTQDEYQKDASIFYGITWWGDATRHTITRDYTNNKLLVSMTQPRGMYVPFGIAFGDDNGATALGNPYTIDLSANGKFSFDITNTGTEALSVRVACQDVQNRQVDCSPGASGFNNIWQYQTQILVPIGETVTFEAGTQNGAGGGKTNTCDFTQDVWGDYGTHTIRTDCDLKHIKSINLTVLNAAKDPGDGHALALTDGKFTISNFIVGDTSATAVSAPDPFATLPITTLDLPNPVRVDSTIYITTTGRWSVKSSAIWLSALLYNSPTDLDSIVLIASSNTTASARTATVTFSCTGAETKTITVTQAAAVSSGINDVPNSKNMYRIKGNSIIIESNDVEIYSILGKQIIYNGAPSVLLKKGIYIIKTDNSIQKIMIN